MEQRTVHPIASEGNGDNPISPRRGGEAATENTNECHFSDVVDIVVTKVKEVIIPKKKGEESPDDISLATPEGEGIVKRSFFCTFTLGNLRFVTVAAKAPKFGDTSLNQVRMS
tara:strand:- start:627 stop:965 length:339 start_codon:yes stop_codon:yes gene_type:complete